MWEVLWFHIACLFLIVSQYRYKRSWEKENACRFMVCATVSGEGNGRYLSVGGGALRAYAHTVPGGGGVVMKSVIADCP
ncbi:hypothetical protein [Bacteroides stercorirosoris]|uniref:hypothetical protein n=1 Tax=Bacteroides stercorirosoris TaxID=871324 RepID=UPI0023F8967D|nr:hypothetical protein [Bacteroides stercorirosoris]